MLSSQRRLLKSWPSSIISSRRMTLSRVVGVAAEVNAADEILFLFVDRRVRLMILLMSSTSVSGSEVKSMNPYSP